MGDSPIIIAPPRPCNIPYRVTFLLQYPSQALACVAGSRGQVRPALAGLSEQRPARAARQTFEHLWRSGYARESDARPPARSHWNWSG